MQYNYLFPYVKLPPIPRMSVQEMLKVLVHSTEEKINPLCLGLSIHPNTIKKFKSEVHWGAHISDRCTVQLGRATFYDNHGIREIELSQPMEDGFYVCNPRTYELQQAQITGRTVPALKLRYTKMTRSKGSYYLAEIDGRAELLLQFEGVFFLAKDVDSAFCGEDGACSIDHTEFTLTGQCSFGKFKIAGIIPCST